jgi:hypothetical protein
MEWEDVAKLEYAEPRILAGAFEAYQLDLVVIMHGIANQTGTAAVACASSPCRTQARVNKPENV